MNRQSIKKISAAGALILSLSSVPLPAASQQGHCGAGSGSGSMGTGHMPMMGGDHTGMMRDMMGGGHMGMMGSGPMEMMHKYKRLGLSDAQEEQIQDIAHRLHKQHWALMGQMIDVRAELRKAQSPDRPDPKTVGAVYGKMFDLRRQMIEANVEAQNMARDVLSAEQIANMKQMKRKRRQMMHGQGGMMHGQGGMMQGHGGMMHGQGGMMHGQGGQTH